MWDSLFGYFALITIFGTMLVIFYVLAIVTFLIRKLIAPEYDIPKVSLTTHKYILIGIGIVFLIGFALFALTFTPVILAILVFYLFYKVVPIVWKRLLA